MSCLPGNNQSGCGFRHSEIVKYIYYIFLCHQWIVDERYTNQWVGFRCRRISCAGYVLQKLIYNMVIIWRLYWNLAIKIQSETKLNHMSDLFAIIDRIRLTLLWQLLMLSENKVFSILCCDVPLPYAFCLEDF